MKDWILIRPCVGTPPSNRTWLMRVPSVTRERRAGNPAAPGGSPLPLLPLGPDGVRRSPPRRTHPDARLEDNPRTRGCQPLAEPHRTGPRSPPHPRRNRRAGKAASRRPAAAAVLTRLVGPTSRVTQMDWRRRLRPARACARQRPGSRAQENRGTARIIQRGSPCLSAIATAREAEGSVRHAGAPQPCQPGAGQIEEDSCQRGQ